MDMNGIDSDLGLVIGKGEEGMIWGGRIRRE